jgi:predicted homoserine dehydrogenase-like protein
MFLAQVPSIAGLDVAAISDLDPERARAACRKVGWDAARIARTRFSEHGRDVCIDERVEVVVEATGDAPAGIAHAIQAIEAASTSLWSMSKPTHSRGRGSPAKREPPA